jgi:hypothetical protein
MEEGTVCCPCSILLAAFALACHQTNENKASITRNYVKKNNIHVIHIYTRINHTHTHIYIYIYIYI